MSALEFIVMTSFAIRSPPTTGVPPRRLLWPRTARFVAVTMHRDYVLLVRLCGTGPCAALGPPAAVTTSAGCSSLPTVALAAPFPLLWGWLAPA